MILICGASGLVGKEMSYYFEENNIDFIGTYNNNKIDKSNMFKINFSDSLAIENFLLEYKITFCIFCIVERLTDICETNWSAIKTTNIDLVNNTSYICNKLNIKFIHLSTDYVFDGLKQPNFPEDLKNPLQNYGISKLISEYRVLNNCKNYTIIRTPVLYSNLSKIHDNAVTLIGKNIMDLRYNKIVSEDNYSIRRPIYIKDLCKFIFDCIKNNYIGIYHFYNPNNKYTKYEICQKIGTILNININHIKCNNNKSIGIALRPYDTQLSDNKINIEDYNFSNFDETLNLCFKKYCNIKINNDNKKDLFILLDLDGTLIDSNMAHYNSYKKVFDNHNIEFLSINEWNYIILNDNIDNYFKKLFDKEFINIIKSEKRILLKNELVDYTKNSEYFLNFLIKNDFNFCIVTNTSEETIKIFKEKLSMLNEIKQWIYREDYAFSKPNGECYELAKQHYYKNEKYIIGIEDSMVGYKALKEHTDLIYIYNNETLFNNNDCFLFDDYIQLL